MSRAIQNAELAIRCDNFNSEIRENLRWFIGLSFSIMRNVSIEWLHIGQQCAEDSSINFCEQEKKNDKLFAHLKKK